MAGYKETPRQKMIAMMYLVLTALLALNVSKEILDAFVIVNESIETTTTNFTSKLDDSYTNFKKAYGENPAKVQKFWDKAQEVRRLSIETTRYIDSIKYEVIVSTDNNIDNMAEARAITLDELRTKDRFTEPTRYFFGRSVDGSNAVAGRLKETIDDYRQSLLEMLDPDHREFAKLGLETEGPYYDRDGQRQTWEQHNFYYSILVADITILNKLVNEIKNAEFDVIKYLQRSISAKDFKFDVVSARIIPNSHYVLQGDNYEAEVLVAAFDSKADPDVIYMMGVDTLTADNIRSAIPIEGEAGIVKISIPAGSVGPQKLAGIINIPSPLGGTIPYAFKAEYIVGEPSLTVSATKMNVFYIGVDNPVSISVPGIPTEKLRASISAGSLGRSGSEWSVKVGPGNTKAVISVSAEIDGSSRSMGSKEFRVKRVPDPVPHVANKKGGLVAKNTLAAAGGIIPRMPDDFEFELYFQITSFSFVTVRSGDIWERNAKGNKFSPEMIQQIRSARRGTKIWLENIMATGPDGNRKLSTISLKIQ